MDNIIDPAKIRKALDAYEEAAQVYVLNQYIPSQVFCLTPRFEMCAAKHIPTWKTIKSNRNNCCFATYSLLFNNRIVYHGSSIKPYARLFVHLFCLYNDPASYGLVFSDLDKPGFRVSFRCSNRPFFKEEERKKQELRELQALSPALQKNDGTDEMVPLKERRRRLRAAGII
ncbi:MAG: hypothetical protein IKG03_07340 [Clostridiales bacterium]|nr:hypothetical protein [Clostridiales bacterium]